jgi:hypothetical protein
MLLAASVATVHAELRVTAQINSKILKVGDRVTFTFAYTNTFTYDLGISPGYIAFQGLEVRFSNIGSGQKGKLVTFATKDFDYDAIPRNFRLVHPGQTFTRTLQARVLGALPKDLPWFERTPGLYLLFADSAIKLPGCGEYEMTSEYRTVVENRLRLNERQRRVFWVGDIKCPTVKVQFCCR